MYENQEGQDHEGFHHLLHVKNESRELDTWFIS